MKSVLVLLLLSSSPFTSLAGERVDVDIEGLSRAQRKNVEHFLDIERRKKDDDLTAAWIRRLHERAPEQIRAALVPFGFYNVEIDASLEETGEGEWGAVYRVDPGEATIISEVNLRWTGPGKDEPLLRLAIEAFPLAPGDVLDHSVYDSGKTTLIEAATEYGYVRAKSTTAAVRVDRDTNQAVVDLEIDTGPRYYFGEVRIQQDFLDEDLVSDYVTIEPGGPFLNDDLLRFQQGLSGSGYTSVVKIDPRFDQTVDDRVPLEVSLLPNNRHRLAFGLGYDTDRGPRVSARWTHRRINRHGHHSELFMTLGTTQREVNGTYYVPVLDASRDRLAASAGYEYEETSSTERETIDAELGFVRRNLEDTYYLKFFLQFFNERYRAGIQPETTTNLLPIGASARLSEVEDSLFPQRGYYLFGDARAATSAVLSDTSFVRFLARGEYFIPAGSNGRVTLRSDLGTSGVEDFLLYPVSLRFFAGGASSVRGYGYKTLGPEDPDGNVIGGKHLVTLSTEYDYRFLEKWAAAAFIDAGNAFNDWVGLRVGGGLGIRWLSPLGSLKLDVGVPLDEEITLERTQVYIGFGAVL